MRLRSYSARKDLEGNPSRCFIGRGTSRRGGGLFPRAARTPGRPACPTRTAGESGARLWPRITRWWRRRAGKSSRFGDIDGTGDTSTACTPRPIFSGRGAGRRARGTLWKRMRGRKGRGKNIDRSRFPDGKTLFRERGAIVRGRQKRWKAAAKG